MDAVMARRALFLYDAARATFEWDPEKHPRGQPGNAGQFGPGDEPGGPPVPAGLEGRVTHGTPEHRPEGDLGNRKEGTIARAPYYHGTRAELAVGDTIHPADKAGTRNFDPRTTDYYDTNRAYLTNRQFHAASYAAEAVGKGGGNMHVYEVAPVGNVEGDPEFLATGFGSDQVTAASATVTREVPWEEYAAGVADRRRNNWATIASGHDPYPLQASGDWDPAKHPKGEGGRFVETEGGRVGPGDVVSAPKPSHMEQEYDRQLQELTGGKMGLDVLKARLTAGMPAGSSVQISTKVTNMGLSMHGEYYGPSGGRLSALGTFDREFWTDPRHASARMETFILDPSVQGQGIGTTHYAAMAELAQAAGCDRMDLTANINVGGYAWAKVGFVPDGAQLYYALQTKVGVAERASWTMTPEAREAGRAALDALGAAAGTAATKDGPAVPYKAVQDITYGLTGTPGGKEVLLGTSWGGTLDMTDRKAMDRFNAYTGGHLPTLPERRARSLAAAGDSSRPRKLRAEPVDTNGDDAWIWAEAGITDTLTAGGDFDESKHPRDDHGRFGEGGTTTTVDLNKPLDKSGSASPEEITTAIQARFPRAEVETGDISRSELNATLSGFDKVLAQYPNVAGDIASIQLGHTWMHAAGSTMTVGTGFAIVINPSAIRDGALKVVSGELESSKTIVAQAALDAVGHGSVIGAAYEATAIHEMFHVVDGHGILEEQLRNGRTAIKPGFSAALWREGARDMPDATTSDHRTRRPSDYGLGRGFGGYDPTEFYAESMTAHALGMTAREPQRMAALLERTSERSQTPLRWTEKGQVRLPPAARALVAGGSDDSGMSVDEFVLSDDSKLFDADSTASAAVRDALAPLTAAGDFDESKHPRDSHGRFGEGQGDGGVAPEDWQLVGPPATALPYKEYEAARQHVTAAQDAYAAAHISEAGRTAFQGDSPEAQALRGYTIGDYHQVATVLRGQGGSLDAPSDNKAFATVGDQVAALDRAVAQGEVTKDTVVFRGAGNWAADLASGSVVHDAGFVSTSLSREVAAGFGPTFEITVPAGTRAAFTNENVYKVFHEAEVVLGRDHSFRVTGRDGNVTRATLVSR